jgi:hypothetical protein
LAIKLKLDLSKAPTTLKSVIIHQSKFAKSIQGDPNQPNTVIIPCEDESENGVIDVKRQIKDILIQFRIRDYVAVTDPEDPQKVLILSKKDAEKLDSFHCHHCGMEFVDEIQLGIHQRLHLPF